MKMRVAGRTELFSAVIMYQCEPSVSGAPGAWYGVSLSLNSMMAAGAAKSTTPELGAGAANDSSSIAAMAHKPMISVQASVFNLDTIAPSRCGLPQPSCASSASKAYRA
jgi:hypothetical protein